MRAMKYYLDVAQFSSNSFVNRVQCEHTVAFEVKARILLGISVFTGSFKIYVSTVQPYSFFV